MLIFEYKYTGLKTILILIFIGVYSSVFSQPFGSQNSLSEGNPWGGNYLQCSDIDSDTYVDIIVSGWYNIYLYKNTGDGTFQFQDTIIHDVYSDTFIFQDIDNDGATDIIYFNVDEGKLLLRKNDGTGNFLESEDICENLKSPTNILSRDITNDGYADIIISSGPHNNINSVWLSNDGVGNFTIDDTLMLPFNGIVSGLTDFNQDNELDLIVKSDSGLYWMINDGLGNFSQITNITNSYTLSFDLCDMDGDLDKDLVCSFYSPEHLLCWKENVGDGIFINLKIIDTTFVRTIKCNDFDNDSDQDILTAGNCIQLLENDGNNKFNDPVIFFDAISSPQLQIDDFNNDGLVDFTFILYPDDLLWSENTGDLAFEGPLLLSSKTKLPSSVSLYDIDEDNDLDILTLYNFDPATISFLENNSFQTFSEPSIIFDTSFRSNSYSDLLIKDLDQDDIEDIYFSTSVRVFWMKGLGMGNYDSPELILGPDTYFLESTNSKICDIDNNNTLDVVLARLFSIVSMVNDGTGSFTQKQDIYTGYEVYSTIDIGNLNDDTFPDLMYVDHTNERIYTRENDGQGYFVNEELILDPDEKPAFACMGDIDNDQDNDIIVSLETKIINLINQGNGHFSPINILEQNVLNPDRIFLKDIDEDGDLDVFYGFNTKYIGWNENNGDGTFKNVQVITDKICELRGITFGDLDGDGDCDLISASAIDSKIAWYENLRINTGIFLPGNAIEQKRFTIYPNPSIGNLFIRSEMQGCFYLQIFSMNGELLINKKIDFTEYTIPIKINLSPNPYLFIIRNDEKILYNEKVILIK